MPKRTRADRLLVQRGLAPSLQRAQALIMAGRVSSQDRRIDKAGTLLINDAPIHVRGQDNPYASRGGLKLHHAIHSLDIPPLLQGQVALDVGASTGGFTDCLLQHGIQHVYAIDVGYGQLAWKLRNDPRVTNLERTNIRTLDPTRIETPASWVVADCSFISLKRVLPPILPLTTPDASLLVLVKPQFEVAREDLEKGVVRDQEARYRAIESIRKAAQDLGLHVHQSIDCAVPGPQGNVEHFLWLQRRPAQEDPST